MRELRAPRLYLVDSCCAARGSHRFDIASTRLEWTYSRSGEVKADQSPPSSLGSSAAARSVTSGLCWYTHHRLPDGSANRAGYSSRCWRRCRAGDGWCRLRTADHPPGTHKPLRACTRPVHAQNPCARSKTPVHTRKLRVPGPRHPAAYSSGLRSPKTWLTPEICRSRAVVRSRAAIANPVASGVSSTHPAVSMTAEPPVKS